MHPLHIPAVFACYTQKHSVFLLRRTRSLRSKTLLSPFQKNGENIGSSTGRTFNPVGRSDFGVAEIFPPAVVKRMAKTKEMLPRYTAFFPLRHPERSAAQRAESNGSRNALSHNKSLQIYLRHIALHMQNRTVTNFTNNKKVF